MSPQAPANARRKVSTRGSARTSSYDRRIAGFRRKAKAMGLDTTNPTWESAYFQIKGGDVGTELAQMVIEAQRAGWRPECVGGPATGKLAWRPKP